MGRKKKKIVKIDLSEDDVKKKLKIARERRMQKAGITKKDVEENTRDEFRKYFLQIKRQFKFENDMENIIWLHFKSAGFDKKDLFGQGIKHFGYN